MAISTAITCCRETGSVKDKKKIAHNVLTADRLEDVPATISKKNFSQKTRITGTGVLLQYAEGCRKTLSASMNS
jgi:hypothetical protein